MGRMVHVLLAASFAIVAAGCGSGSNVKEGDLYEATQEIRVEGEARWADGSTEGFTCTLPSGTVVKALYDQRPGIPFFESMPTQIKGKTSEEEITNALLPPHLQTEPGLEGLTLPLSTELIGTKLKKVD